MMTDSRHGLSAMCVAAALLLTDAGTAVHSSAGAPVVDARVLDNRSGRARATLQLVSEDGRVILNVKGGMGIGRATVERLSENWPSLIVLRLHFQGLEGLKIDTGTTLFSWAVPSSAGGLTLMSIRENGGRRRVARTDPNFAGVRLVAAKPRIPLVDGYFEVTLPASVFSDNPGSVLIHWVDFYR